MKNNNDPLSLNPVGKNVPRIDGRGFVTGQTKYVSDLVLPGMLFGKMLRSPHAHAKILKIDTSKAEELHGVKAIITAKDTLGVKFGSNEYFFPQTADQQALEADKVRYIGDEIAAVAAVDEETAERALKLIDVHYEILPAVFDALEAMKPGAPQIHEARNNIALILPTNFGNVERALKESDYVREDTFYLPSAAHTCLEPHVCIGQWEEHTQKVTLWVSTQAPFKIRETLAKCLHMNLNDVRVIKLAVGGGFGGKLEMLPMDFAACLLSKKAKGAPVKIMYTREEEFSFSRRKHPMIYRLKSGVKKDGTLMAISGEVIADGGAYCSYGPTVLAASMMRIMMVYKIQNLKITGYRVYTNNPISGAIRGFGGVQSGFAVESHIDLLAQGIGMDPVAFRLKNITEPNMVTVNKMILSSNGLKECIEKAAESCQWKQRHGKQKHVRRGLGIGIAADVMGSKMYKSHESAGTVIKVEEDASVYVLTGAADTGQGSNTVLSQIAAQELGISYNRIRITAADTAITPFDTGSFASRVTFISGNATKLAAADAKRQILDIVAHEKNLDVNILDIQAEQVINTQTNSVVMTFDKAVELCYSFNYGTQIIGRGSYNPKTTPVDFRTGEGNVSGSYSFEAQIAEVEVNTETGHVKVLKMWDAHDVGRAINPQSVKGQIEGSLFMGIGYTLWENLQFKDGRVVNPNFANYRLARSISACPVESILIETNDPQGPFGAKGMGEAALLPTAAAIANAIEDAVGVRIKDLPITPEKVLKALKIKNDQEKKMRSQKNNFQKLRFFFLFILVLTFFIFNVQNAESESVPSVEGEGDNLAQAVTRLQTLACSMLPTQCASYKDEEYFTTNCPGGGDVCWNSSSIVGSTADLGSRFDMGIGQAWDNGGDVRFRCRRQKDTIYCFAFRCVNEEPAGCEQMWRIDYQFKITSSGSPESLYIDPWASNSKCVDVGSTDYHGIRDYPVCNDIHTDNSFPCELDDPNYQCTK